MWRVRPQRLGLASRAVQREHVQRPQALAVRVLDRQRIELGDDLAMAAGAQVGVDARLERRQPQLVEAGDLTVEESVGLDVGVGVAAPHRQRLAKPGRDLVGIEPSCGRRVGTRPRTPTASIVASVQSSR